MYCHFGRGQIGQDGGMFPQVYAVNTSPRHVKCKCDPLKQSACIMFQFDCHCFQGACLNHFMDRNEYRCRALTQVGTAQHCVPSQFQWTSDRVSDFFRTQGHPEIFFVKVVINTCLHSLQLRSVAPWQGGCML